MTSFTLGENNIGCLCKLQIGLNKLLLMKKFFGGKGLLISQLVLSNLCFRGSADHYFYEKLKPRAEFKIRQRAQKVSWKEF